VLPSHSRSIDIHAHYFGQHYLELFNEQRERYGTEFHATKDSFSFKSPIGSFGTLPIKFIDAKQRVAEMDQQGIAIQALSLTGPMVYWAEPEFSLKLARAWNDDAIAAHKAFPDRLVVLATLPMLDPDRAIDELNRVHKLPGVRGIYMGTNIDSRDLDDPLFEPIFARIAALDLPVFLHPQQTIGGKRLDPFYLSNFLRWGTRPPSETANQSAARGRRAAGPDRAHRSRLDATAGNAAPRQCAKHVSAAVHLRHDLAFRADPEFHHFAGWCGPRDDRQRLLLRHGI
jgi:predicted TIM-barrel fold metal-dependent hydrolase